MSVMSANAMRRRLGIELVNMDCAVIIVIIIAISIIIIIVKTIVINIIIVANIIAMFSIMTTNLL